MDGTEKTYRVLRLVAENYKRLKAVDITPAKNVVEVTGRNRAGKTSLLDAVAAALGGKKAMAQQPVRVGEDAGVIVCTLGEGDKPELLVKRVFTADGKTALEIVSADGYAAPSPQAILDSLCGKIAFDPLAFVRMDDAEQFETLRRLVGLDFAEIDDNRKQIYSQRTELNKQSRTLAAQAAGLYIPPDTPTEEVSVSDLMMELRTRQLHNRQNQIERDKAGPCDTAVNFAQRDFVRVQAAINDLEARLAELRKDYEIKHNAVSQAIIVRDTQKATLALLVDSDTEEIQHKVLASQSTNEFVRKDRQKRDLEHQVIRAKEAADLLTAKLDAIDRDKEQKMAQVQWPVENLGFSDSGVLYNGLPFSQASGAEQLRVSVAMGAAMNPRLKVMLCRDASLLDVDEMQAVSELANKYDLQLWLETVGTDAGPAAVLIEDGMVVSGGTTEDGGAVHPGKKRKPRTKKPKEAMFVVDEVVGEPVVAEFMRPAEPPPSLDDLTVPPQEVPGQLKLF
jgi:energy-coupling factor transporter ATP-binding protein EcfA2